MTHPADLLPDFDHITNHAFKRSLGPLARREPSTLGIYEADHACLLRTDLPGFKNSKVSLKFEEGVLRVRAEGILEITHPKLETGNAGGLSIESNWKSSNSQSFMNKQSALNQSPCGVVGNGDMTTPSTQPGDHVEKREEDISFLVALPGIPTDHLRVSAEMGLLPITAERSNALPEERKDGTSRPKPIRQL